jgi:integrase
MACVRKRKNKAGKDRWVYDFRDQNGVRRWRVFDTRREADDAMAALRLEVKERRFIDPATVPTFEAVAREWLATRSDRAPGTVRFWTSQIELHLLPAFGGKRIDQIKPQDVQTFKLLKWNEEKADKAGLARTTVNQLLQTLRGVLKYAVECEHIARNPAAPVEGLRKRRQGDTADETVDPRDVLMPEQAGALIEAAAPGLYRTFIKLALLTGCRSGEMLALRWSDLDLDVGMLSVNRSLSWVRGQQKGYGQSVPHFGPPKTESSRRTLELAPDLLHEFKAWFLRSRFKADDNLVFTNTLGKPLHRSFLHKGVTEAAVAAGLPHISLHGLRHSFASIAIAEGMPVTQVSKLLGHKDPEITLKRYSHWFRAASSLDAMLTIAGAILRANGRSVVGGANSGA